MLGGGGGSSHTGRGPANLGIIGPRGVQLPKDDWTGRPREVGVQPFFDVTSAQQATPPIEGHVLASYPGREGEGPGDEASHVPVPELNNG